MTKSIYGFLAAALLLCSYSSQAQLFVGAGLFNNKYLGDYSKSHPGLQLRAGYGFADDRLGVVGGLNFSPSKGKESYGSDFSDGNGHHTTLQTQQSVGMQNMFIHARYRFGNPDNALHFKLIFGLSVDFISISYKTLDAIPAGYADKVYTNESTNGAKIDIGGGLDYRVGPGDIYFETILGLPANEQDGAYYYNPTVAHFGIAVGYKFYFGSRGYY